MGDTIKGSVSDADKSMYRFRKAEKISKTFTAFKNVKLKVPRSATRVSFLLMELEVELKEIYSETCGP